MHKHVGVAALALTIGAPALGADMAAKVPLAPVHAAAPPVISWTGFYLGGNIGGVIGHASGTSDFTDTTPNPSNPLSNSLSEASFLGGVQFGYNWQFASSWVVGFEGDWDWSDPHYSFCHHTDPYASACFDNSAGFETISSKTNWLATARGRLGVTLGNWLLYGTGGAAWGRVDTTLTLSCLVMGCGATSTVALLASSTSSTTKAGWVAGLGTELMLAPNWSARAEWLHIDLGTITNSLPTVGTAGTIQTAIWSRSERFDEFRLGLNYLFR